MADLTYAIADLHGAFDLLKSALAAIERHGAAAHRRTCVFLGDYVDRGPQSREIIERLMAGPPPGWRWICLRGNHEAWMVDSLNGRVDIQDWLRNGGDQTLLSYQQPPVDGSDPSAVLSAHQNWIRALPLFQVDENRVYVHATLDPSLALNEQDEFTLTWERYPTRTVDIGWRDKHVVHGHDPFQDGPVLLKHRTNLDTLAWRTGRLVVGVFDDAKAGGPIDLIEVRRPGASDSGVIRE